jgi:ParB-like chromosome segregation protein Spo0J
MEKFIPLEWHNEKRKVSDLIPYPENPRILTNDQAAQLSKSISKFGLVEIPAINTNNILVAGHQRCKILQMLGRGDEEIDVRVPNRPLTEEEFREYLIRSNKNTGEFSFEDLANGWEIEDLLSYGFTKLELGMTEEPLPPKEKDGNKNREHTCPNCGHTFTESKDA